MNKYIKESWPKNSGKVIKAVEYVVLEKKKYISISIYLIRKQ